MLFKTYGYCALGVFISVLLPILQQTLILLKDFSNPFSSASSIQQAPRIIAITVITGIISLLVAILLVAFVGEQISDWKTAILFGYAWDSTLQRIVPNEWR
jgi:hypothetical protein